MKQDSWGDGSDSSLDDLLHENKITDITQSVDLTEEEKSVEDDLGFGRRSSKVISCCSSDIADFEKIRKIEGQIFKDGKKDIIPEYLKSDFPPAE